jgi:hypothetical protein
VECSAVGAPADRPCPLLSPGRASTPFHSRPHWRELHLILRTLSRECHVFVFMRTQGTQRPRHTMGLFPSLSGFRRRILSAVARGLGGMHFAQSVSIRRAMTHARSRVMDELVCGAAPVSLHDHRLVAVRLSCRPRPPLNEGLRPHDRVDFALESSDTGSNEVDLVHVVRFLRRITP